MRQGDRLELEIETADGAFAVAGATVVPGTEAMTLGNGREVVVMQGPRPPLTLNRDVDTLEIEAREALGRAIQVEVARPDSIGTLRVGFWFVVDSTRLTLPGDIPDFISVFTSDTAELPDELPPVFAAGRSYVVAAGLADVNYFDFIRSGNIPPSGRGFINHLDGGIGVFGSIVAFDNVVRVVGTLDDVREGTYRVSGTVEDVPVDATVELYVAAAGADTTAAAAFIEGAWVRGQINGSLDAQFRGDSVFLRVFQAGPDPSTVVLVGTAPNGGSSTLLAHQRLGFDGPDRPVGSVSMTGPTRAAVSPSAYRQHP
jgi:hypothetical protein